MDEKKRYGAQKKGIRQTKIISSYIFFKLGLGMFSRSIEQYKPQSIQAADGLGRVELTLPARDKPERSVRLMRERGMLQKY